MTPAAQTGKANFQKSSWQAYHAGKPTHGNAQVKGSTCQATEADPTPVEGERQQGRKKKDQDPLLRWLEGHTQSTPEARTVECGAHSATEPTGRPKDDTRTPRGKAGPLQPNCSNSFIRDQIKDPDPTGGPHPEGIPNS